MPPRGHTMYGSMSRTDRTGPTVSGTIELYITTKRVMPPSTTSSYTTSASSRPAWGRASGAFSIFTVSTGRVSAAPEGSTTPVSGATGGGGGGAVVVVLGS